MNYLTTGPSVPGFFRTRKEDFVVDEMRAYEPSGNGDHVYVFFRKSGLNTAEAARMLAERISADPNVIGWAGMKDKFAITTQTVSLLPAHGTEVTRESFDDLPGIEVLDVTRHEHKLRNGKLLGNRFTLRIEEVAEEFHAVLLERFALLQRMGVPNYFGSQRFGFGGSNVTAARRWLIEGGKPPRDKFKRKLWVSVLQSDAFNRVLAHRIEHGLYETVLRGDVLMKEDSGGVFVSEGAVDQERLTTFELSLTGPMPGVEAKAPQGEALALESAILTELGIDDKVLARFGRLGAGTRRPLRTRLSDATLSFEADTALLSFALDSGSYATTVLDALFHGGAVERPRERQQVVEEEGSTTEEVVNER